MEASLKFKVSELFTRYNFSKEDAHFISDVLSEIDERQNREFEMQKDLLLTQKDKVELIGKIGATEIKLTEKIADLETRLTDKINSVYKTIYIVGVVQFSAIIASVLAIINFMLKLIFCLQALYLHSSPLCHSLVHLLVVAAFLPHLLVNCLCCQFKIKRPFNSAYIHGQFFLNS